MKWKQIIDAIKENDTIIIHRHVRPDPDAIGSQVGLKEIIKHSFPSKHVYVVGEDEPTLTFLASMDDIGDNVYENALVIVCDTANRPRIDDQRYTMGRQLIKIDHHPNVDVYGDVSVVDTTASSVSEMIFELYEQGREDGFRLNDTAARLLYAGIVGDTGRFMFPSTTKKTFQYAAELVTYDFDRPALYAELYSVEDNISRLQGYVLQEFELLPSGLCTIKLTKGILEKFHVSPDESSQLVNILSTIKGIKAWVFFIEEEDQIRVRLRSKGPVINEIAANYNGGGHPLASGATIYSWEEADNMTNELESACLAHMR
ncbi:DHH family phosphoesterase [Oceanobacillus polygoni]|uniref:Phosphoesterase RecJ-like protein n=1 Tax=Oceanobacillus polygoni TaxID=1235259 RepID=A0A9X0YRE6_9BACI|nr:bifunctional oligoribonuclease/PAP phosphatase NrnA [Oceanobacillus polygoni]MBP2077343.1 phosphoesterase RecJ-like protein [Oceanobacillus polygoni]